MFIKKITSKKKKNKRILDKLPSKSKLKRNKEKEEKKKCEEKQRG